MALIDLAALITILGGGFALLWLAWKIKLRWWPGLVLRLLLLILVGIAVGKAIENDQDAIYSPEILILDRSESISEEGKFDSQVFATVWKSLRPNRQIIVFGATTDFVLSDDWPEIIRSGSDIAEALNKAGIMLDREPGRVIIATDGLVDNPNDVNGLLGQIKAAGGVVDYVPLEPVKYTSDVFVGQLKGALSVWSGVNFPL